MQYLTRELRLDASKADSAARRVPAVLSTTFEVDRGGFGEVLLHGPDNVDLARAPLPLIESHDGARLNIGLVENLRLTGDALRGDLVLGSSQRALDLWPDIESGIVRNLSIGYAILDQRVVGDRIEATRWMPYEVSLVSVPADPFAGIKRNKTMNNVMSPAPDDGANLSRSQRRAIPAAVEAERSRASEISGIARAYAGADGWRGVDVSAMANDAIEKGLTVAQFQAAMAAASASVDNPVEDSVAADLGRSYRSEHREPRFTTVRAGRRDNSQHYSLVRAIGGMLDPRGIDNGYEREVSQELALRMGRKPRGMFMPTGQLSERSLTVSGAAALVGEDHMAAEFIDVLRARSFVMQLGAKVLSGLTEDVSIPRLTASATSGWIAGDGADGLTESTPAVDGVTLKPHTVGALVTLSRKMVLQGGPDAESMVRDDFAKLIAIELDRAAIAGSGLSNQPKGVIATTGVTAATYPVGGPDFASVLAMEAAMMADNADLGSLAFLTTPALAGVLKGVETATGSGVFVWGSGKERGQGEMVGIPAYASSNVPLDKIVLGNWADLLMGMWGAVDIDVNPYHDFAKGTIAVRVFAAVDFAVRHPESFVVYSRGS